MSRDWIYDKKKFSREYAVGIESFFNVAKNHLNAQNEAHCPCCKCQNIKMHSIAVMRMHLLQDGMSPVYDTWIYHGEQFEQPQSNREDVLPPDADVHEILNNRFPRDLDHESVRDDSFRDNLGLGDDNRTYEHRVEAAKYEKLMTEAKCEFFPGSNGSVLMAMVMLMNMKVQSHITNKGFDTLLDILNYLCPKPNSIPVSFYATNKMLKDLGLGYEKINSCKYNCALFYKEHKFLDRYPECDEPRYKPSTSEKRKKIPQKVLRYLPLKPRLQRLFM
ncbi:uncharacterized protein LOC120259929 [Dioscorea cayenensis subsp. rotundata]|uniref:Uncharacterized protein LOC120259929 n=1 Tax=Dioscorea cayennensis subsp. rotundata TaxID=55577 RepID=A0AB40B829_DIOCR|nr:uncharacterized protein LOC120259929 [Dioscorea cayenensis subsp. rotundata]